VEAEVISTLKDFLALL